MMALKHCTDARCQRNIPEAIFETPAAHAIGCGYRRSLEGKRAYAKKQRNLARGRKAAATRLARRQARQAP